MVATDPECHVIQVRAASFPWAVILKQNQVRSESWVPAVKINNCSGASTLRLKRGK